MSSQFPIALVLMTMLFSPGFRAACQIVRCTSCPSTCIAVSGRAGQRFSHAPHPMHLSSFTVGILREFLSSGFLCTILMAPAGQCLAQLPQLTSSVFTTHRLRSTTACPICTDDFSSRFMAIMAPAGQTSEHFVHSGLQYPLSYDISGCMRVASDAEGLRTLLGHALTHSWQAVQ